MITGILVIGWATLLINNPYLISLIFFLVVFLGALMLVRYSKFIRFILFLVYVGGIMILVRYCVILSPTSRLQSWRLLPFVLAVIYLSHTPTPVSGHSYGLLCRASAIFLLALLLYVVMIAVVEIINYSSGMIKLYDRYLFLYNCFHPYHYISHIFYSSRISNW